MRDERAHLQLFDLIAREWQLPCPATGVTFNADSSALAFALQDGGVMVAATADRESADSRTRRALDTGRLTIAPRERDPLPLKRVDFTEGRSSAVVAMGPQGFAFAKENGRINAVSAGGIAAHIAPRAAAAISVLAAGGGRVAWATAEGFQVWTGEAVQSFRAAARVRALAFSPDGETLAVGYANGLCRWRFDGAMPVETAVTGACEGLAWHPAGTHLAASLAHDGLALVETATNRVTQRGHFPAPVGHCVFGGGAVLAPGAYRVAGWSLEGADLTTGKPGLMLVDALAAAPDRGLVAVGYANGLVSLAEIGKPAEILLRENTGAGIAAMAWSPDGRFLGLAGQDGAAALVEFPATMFKS